MASKVGQREKFVLISDALAYIAERTGFAFERRQFARYVERLRFPPCFRRCGLLYQNSPHQHS